MSIFHTLITRRHFIRVVTSTSVALINLDIKETFASPQPQKAVLTHGYGMGGYGKGEYRGYKTYLPFVNGGK